MTVTDATTDPTQVSSANSDDQLPLSDLYIRGFRGLDKLEVPKLGRVTLLTGKNGVGKSTILDGVRMWAERGSPASIHSVLSRHDELVASIGEKDEPFTDVDVSALFFGRHIDIGSKLTIGSTSSDHILALTVDELGEERQQSYVRYRYDTATQGSAILASHFAGARRPLPWVLLNNGDIVKIDGHNPPSNWKIGVVPTEEDDTPCTLIGPGLPDDRLMNDFWFKVALTEDEDKVVDALRMVVGEEVERVALIGHEIGSRPSERRRFVTRIRGFNGRVPLKSYGDGALRVLSVALALANSRDGFLLLDEAENGIHYSIQSDFWRLIFCAAHDLNVQVIATTHSYDCVRGFAQAALENEEVEGRLVQLSSRNGKTYVGELPEKELVIAARQRIEVRG